MRLTVKTINLFSGIFLLLWILVSLTLIYFFNIREMLLPFVLFSFVFISSITAFNAINRMNKSD